MTEHSGVGEELTLPGDGTWNDESDWELGDLGALVGDAALKLGGEIGHWTLCCYSHAFNYGLTDPRAWSRRRPRSLGAGECSR